MDAAFQTFSLIVLSETSIVFLIVHAHVKRAATFLVTVVMTSWTSDALVSSVLEIHIYMHVYICMQA